MTFRKGPNIEEREPIEHNQFDIQSDLVDGKHIRMFGLNELKARDIPYIIVPERAEEMKVRYT